MHLAAAVCMVLFLSPHVAPAQPVDENAGVLGGEKGTLVIREFTSKIFGNTRKLRIFLPAGYSAPQNRTKRYPVLYLNDGQNLFDIKSSIFNKMEWRVDETTDSLRRLGLVLPMIIVGIDNAGRHLRSREYLPYPDEFLTPPEPSPQGKLFPRFVVQEVMPFINSQYRTKTGPDETGFGGSSYGALPVLYSVIATPGVFGRLLVESPSLYVHDNQLLKDLRKMKSWPGRIYVGIGTNELNKPDCQPGNWDSEPVQDVLALKKILEDAGLQKQLHVVIEDCATHNEDAWARRFPAALEFLFGARQEIRSRAR